MAKRRKVGNLLALAVLGTVVQRPMHPYEMASLLRARGKDQDMPIKWGSLYTVVQNLEKHGFLAATESVRQGGRPERTIYQITEAGRDELKDWVRELLAYPEREHTRFKAALSVLGALSPEESIELLRNRLDLLERTIQDQKPALLRDTLEIPRLFLIEEEYDLAMRQAEANWVRSVLTELESGEFPDLGIWAAYHRGEEIPPDMAELAERAERAERGLPPSDYGEKT